MKLKKYYFENCEVGDGIPLPEGHVELNKHRMRSAFCQFKRLSKKVDRSTWQFRFEKKDGIINYVRVE